MAVGLKNWSTTAGSNGTADSNIGMAEGQTPASLNNGVRALMAALAAWYDLIGGVATQGGSVNAYTITNAAPNTWAGYGDGDIVMLVPNATNTSTSVTVAVDGLAVKRVKKSDETDPAVGVLVAGGFYLLVYSATTGHFQIINSATGTGAYQPLDGTLTAFAALAWSAGRQVPVLTAADTLSLITTTAASELVLSQTSNTAMLSQLGGYNLAATNNTYTQTTAQIIANTADGSDSSSFSISGGGGPNATRGGTVAVYGNEHANAGLVLIRAGSGVTGGISIDAGGGVTTVAAGDVVGAATGPTSTRSLGYRGTIINTQNGAYGPVLDDAGQTIYHTSASAHTYTIPANASVAFPIGTIIAIENESGGGNVTVAITTDTLRWGSSTGSRTLAANGSAVLKKVASTTWRMTGTGIT